MPKPPSEAKKDEVKAENKMDKMDVDEGAASPAKVVAASSF